MKKVGSGEYGLLITYVGGRHEERWFEASESRRSYENKIAKDPKVLIASTIGKNDNS